MPELILAATLLALAAMQARAKATLLRAAIPARR